MKQFGKIFPFLVLFTSLTANVFADRRAYIWTYEYMTMPQGMTEAEYYLTTIVPKTDKTNINTWKHWIELEYGITNNLDVAMYQMFKQENKDSSSDFEYNGFKIRARYKIGKKNKLPIDPLLYMEYKRDDDFSKASELEAKIILAKDIEKFNIAYNQILEQELENGGKTKHEYAAGISYSITPLIKLGLESKGNFTEKKYYLGPVVSLSAKRIWFSSGLALGVNSKSDDIQTRVIIGIHF